MAVRTCIQQYMILKAECTNRGAKKLSVEISTKSLQSNSHESKLIPDGRVTKLITHADTHNTDILTLQEEDCQNQRIQIKLGKIKTKQ